jgi:hypothetical protein
MNISEPLSKIMKEVLDEVLIPVKRLRQAETCDLTKTPKIQGIQ